MFLSDVTCASQKNNGLISWKCATYGAQVVEIILLQNWSLEKLKINLRFAFDFESVFNLSGGESGQDMDNPYLAYTKLQLWHNLDVPS